METDVGILRSLSRSEFSGVRLLSGQEMTLSLDKSFTNSVNDGITEVISSKLMQFDPSLNGVLLERENITCFNPMSEVLEDLEISSFQVSVHSNFYVFAPRKGEFLDVAVMTVGRNHATAVALGTFKVLIQNIPRGSEKLEVGQALTVRIVSVAYKEGLPDIIGVCNDLTGLTSQKGIFVDVSTICKVEENDWRERSTEGDRMELEDFEADEEELRVKKPRRKKSMKIPKDRKAKDPEWRVKKSRRSISGRNEFVLPTGFTVINKKSKMNTWKEYQGPDGVKYRSLVAIQRAQAQGFASCKDENNARPENI